MPNAAQDAPMRLLKVSQVAKMTGICRTSIYTYIAEAGFPKPIALSPRINAWLEHEIVAWIQQKAESRNPRFEEPRRRGRPRKHPRPDEAVQVDSKPKKAPAPPPPAEPRRRGRPRKSQPVAA